MQQFLGIDPLAVFALRRIEARGWHVSVHLVNDTVEMHAVRVETSNAHIACRVRPQLVLLLSPPAQDLAKR